MIVEAPCLTEQLGYAHVLDTIFTYMCAIEKLHFYLKFGFFWVSRARETTNQVEVVLTVQKDYVPFTFFCSLIWGNKSLM